MGYKIRRLDKLHRQETRCDTKSGDSIGYENRTLDKAQKQETTKNVK